MKSNEILSYATWVQQDEGDLKVLKTNSARSTNEISKKFFNLADLFDYYAQKNESLPFLGKKNANSMYEFSSFGDVRKKVSLASIYILLLKARVYGILSKNREEYIVMHLTLLKLFKIIVPIYFDVSQDFFDIIMVESKVEVLVIENNLQNLQRVQEACEKGKLLSLKYIILLKNYNEECDLEETMRNELLEKLKIKSLKFIYYESVISEDNLKVEENKQSQKEGDSNSTLMVSEFNEHVETEPYATINYKFGTKNPQKPIVLSHKALVSCVESLVLYLEHLNLTEEDSYYSYIPLSNTSELMLIYSLAFFKVNTSFSSCMFQNIIDDVKVLKPTVFFGVSRIISKLTCMVKNIIDKLDPSKKEFINNAIKVKMSCYNDKGVIDDHMLFDKLIFNKVKSLLGGRVSVLIVDIDNLHERTINYFKICFSIKNVICLYGKTETTSWFLGSYKEDSENNHVGGPMNNVEIKLIDNDLLGFHNNNKFFIEYSRDVNVKVYGELCVKCDFMYEGSMTSFENGEFTLKSQTDSEGWFHTGDIAYFCPSKNCIKIIDKIENFIEVEKNKWVSANELEKSYSESLLIDYIVLFQNKSNELSAIVVPVNSTGTLPRKGSSDSSDCESTGSDDLRSRKKEYQSLSSSSRPICRVDKKQPKNEKAFNMSRKNSYSTNSLEVVYDIKTEVEKSLEGIWKENNMKPSEKIKRIIISPESFTIENGLLNHTLKLNRPEILKKFCDDSY